ncbi:hypothetical protein EXN66_Car001883 [Channa argus]|uniref:Secreted protein n=1 Tax=Channa argus TaxID=215402 RepID=A0A6G1P7F6_CHAAH|nr:hypothetical protein EXN66_Car001883 [Channa argus]
MWSLLASFSSVFWIYSPELYCLGSVPIPFISTTKTQSSVNPGSKKHSVHTEIHVASQGSTIQKKMIHSQSYQHIPEAKPVTSSIIYSLDSDLT